MDGLGSRVSGLGSGVLDPRVCGLGSRVLDPRGLAAYPRRYGVVGSSSHRALVQPLARLVLPCSVAPYTHSVPRVS
eukprot:1998853-Rhodomonas_salina.2